MFGRAPTMFMMRYMRMLIYLHSTSGSGDNLLNGADDRMCSTDYRL